MIADSVESRVTGPFLLERIRKGVTARVHSHARVEVSLDLGFGVHLHRVFFVDGIRDGLVPSDKLSDAAHCMVVLLGGKRLLVQPENERPTCSYARLYLNEKIYGNPVGFVQNVEKLERPILDVAVFFEHLSRNHFDLRLVYNAINSRRSRDGDTVSPAQE